MATIPGLKLPTSSVFKLGSSWKGEGVCHLIKHSNNLKTKQDQPDLNSSALTPPCEKQPCFFKNTHISLTDLVFVNNSLSFLLRLHLKSSFK